MSEKSYIVHNRKHTHSSPLHGDFECNGPLKFNGYSQKLSKPPVEMRQFTCMATGRAYEERKG